MVDLLLELIPPAIGLALSPTIIAIGILFLGSRRPVQNAVAFLIPFVLFYTLISLIVLVSAQASQEPLISDGTKHWLTLGIGVLLLGLAVLGLRGKEAHDRPRWMAQIEAAGPVTALGMGLAFAVLNPNVPILLAGLASVAATSLSVWDHLVAICVLVGASVIGLVVPLAWYLIQPESAQKSLDKLKDWLVQNQKRVNEAVLIVFGTVFAVRGLAGILA